ncbi:hypothetical protein SNE40_016036 [Patella caerulea]|uniref:Uncharacterized protein n=1 Tax=Patella caerulea TaxID=87958 RepID=A0AAN8J836_PATCE
MEQQQLDVATSSNEQVVQPLDEFTRISYIGMEHDKWIVVNIPQEENQAKFAMSRVKGWKIVITGNDYAKPFYCKIPYCIYLSPSVITKIELPLPEELLIKSYHLGFIGYLYAIQHGAKYILSVSADVHSLTDLDMFQFRPTTSGIVYNEAEILNPDIFAGETLKQKVPYGQNPTGEGTYPYTFFLEDEINPVLQLPLYSCSTFKYENNTINFSTDPKLKNHTKLAPIFSIPSGLVRLTSSVVLYKHEIFWSLFMNLVHETTNSLVYKRIVEQILEKLNFRVMLIPFKPCTKELPVNQTSSNVSISPAVPKEYFLCPETSLYQCLLRMAKSMHSGGHMNDDDLISLETWLFVLAYISYKEPVFKRKARSAEATDNIRILMSTHMYSDADTEFLENLSPLLINATNAKNVCPDLNMSWKEPIMDDVMLIVTFNEIKWYINMPYIELMYRRYFKHILVCGPMPEAFAEVLSNNSYITTFFHIDALNRGWVDMFECTQYAMMMNFRVKGYLQIGDDTLVNVWNMFRLPRDQIILPNVISWYNRSSEQQQWYYWDIEIGRPALNKLMAALENAALVEGDKMAKQYLDMYKYNMKDTSIAFYRGGDFFYIPEKLRDAYIYISKACLRHKLMDEVAIPTFTMGLAESKDIFRVRDGSLWRQEARDQYALFFDINTLFIHPFKLGKFFANKTDSNNFFCDPFMKFSLLKIKSLATDRLKPLINTGIVWNNMNGGPVRPGEKHTFITG